MMNFQYPFNPQPAPAPVEEICVVFTDIVDSTALWEFDEAIALASIQLHHKIVRHLIQQFNGYEVKVMGDGFMIIFETAQTTLLFCLSVQLALEYKTWPLEESNLRAQLMDDKIPNATYPVSEGLKIRMGLDFGMAYRSEPDPITGRMDYYGRLLNKAARIQSNAKGWEIAVSDYFISKLHWDRHNQMLASEGLDNWKRAEILHGDCPRPLFVIVPIVKPSLKGIAGSHHVTLIQLIPQCH